MSSLWPYRQFARILPRLLELERPSGFPVRGAIFTQVRDHIAQGNRAAGAAPFDRNKILISVHPRHQDVWYWTIPFSNGYCSLGVVAEQSYLARYQGNEMQRLRAIVAEEPGLASLLEHAEWDMPARQIVGYSSNVSALWGKNYALLGNAGEFLDPVFSSGVTIAFTSADLAAKCLAKQFAGETVDWQAEYAEPLKRGVDAFRRFVDSWYA
ncbi:MAG: FAD-dependent oxidoreductase, partial [Verrucomicrobiaceae bacterium]